MESLLLVLSLAVIDALEDTKSDDPYPFPGISTPKTFVVSSGFLLTFGLSGGEISQFRLIVFFENDRLTRVEGDFKPEIDGEAPGA